MATSAIPFSYGEAARLRDRRVRLMQRLGNFPSGLTGVVTDQHAFHHGYMVEVQWDGMTKGSAITFEYFTKDDFIEYLTEC